jgi:hypothetical protein
VPSGSTEVVTTDFYSLNENRWMAAIPSGDQAQYERQLTIQQFSWRDIAGIDEAPEGLGRLDTPLDGSVDTANVQFKLLDIEVTNNRTLGAPPYRIRALQAF